MARIRHACPPGMHPLRPAAHFTRDPAARAALPAASPGRSRVPSGAARLTPAPGPPAGGSALSGPCPAASAGRGAIPQSAGLPPKAALFRPAGAGEAYRTYSAITALICRISTFALKSNDRLAPSLKARISSLSKSRTPAVSTPKYWTFEKG